MPRKEKPTPYSDTTLKSITMVELRATFARHGHDPSPGMWDALEDLVDRLAAMADGNCSPVFYLSSLDPGVGKTQTVVHFLRALIADPRYSDVGVLIAVFRLDEISALVRSAQLPEDKFAVYTSDEKLNALGSGQPQSSQVLFTTHQMLESRTKWSSSFANTKAFHFGDHPRTVRVWDETLEPAKAITLNRDNLLRLVGIYRPFHSGLADDLDDLSTELKGLNDGDVFDVPDLGSKHSLDLGSGLSLISSAPRDDQDIASDLWLLSGKTVTVRHDGIRGNTLTDYHPNLPDDLAPLLILDASGRLKVTYHWWEKRRRDLVPLRAAAKNYRNLNVHIWERGGGKTAFADQETSSVLLQGIAHTINSKSDQEWLIVCHKLPKRDLEREIRKLVSVDQENLHFITWGNHKAVNDYVDVPNVILAGTLFYRASHYEALGRAAAASRATERRYGKKHDRLMMETEQQHLVLQALCRGTVRKSQGDTCAPCDAYVIASVYSGIPKTIHEVFPGCQVSKWQPVEVVLKGKVREAADYVLKKLEADRTALIPFKVVSDALGMTSQNFGRSVRQHEDFQDVLAENGIVERSKSGDGQARYFGNAFFLHFDEADIQEEGGFSIEEYLKERPDLPAQDDRETVEEQPVEASDELEERDDIKDSRVSVVLRYVPQRRAPVVTELSKILGIYFGDALDLIDAIPVTIKSDLDRSEAEKIAARLDELGASVEVR